MSREPIFFLSSALIHDDLNIKTITLLTYSTIFIANRTLYYIFNKNFIR